MSPVNLSRRAALRTGFLVLAGSPFVIQWTRLRRFRQEQIHRRTFHLFGTRVHVVVAGTSRELAEVAIREAAAEAELIHQLMTTHDQNSPLAEVNRVSGASSVAVDWRIRQVVSESLDFSHRFDGLFDVTTLPLLKAWGLRDQRFDVEVDETTIQKALELVGYQQVEITDTRLGLKRRGAAMDLGGIAKGFAVDRMVKLLKKRGIRRALVEAGGDLYALGSPPDADHWTVGVQTKKGAGVCATLQLRDQAVATSGISENQLTRAGRTVGHLLDPHSGKPAGRYASTSVVAATTLEADALSTTLYVASGRELEGWPAGGAGWLHVQVGRDQHPIFETGGSLPRWQPAEPEQSQNWNRRRILGI